MLLADIVIPVPTTAVIAALGIVYGPIAGTLVAVLGMGLAAGVGYGIGRCLGRPVVDRLFRGALLEGEQLFARRGGWIVAVSRWLPVLPEVVSVAAGLGRMTPAIFMAAALCGIVPICAVFAIAGHLGADRPVATLLISAAAPVGLWLLVRRFGPKGHLRDDPPAGP